MEQIHILHYEADGIGYHGSRIRNSKKRLLALQMHDVSDLPRVRRQIGDEHPFTILHASTANRSVGNESWGLCQA
jgi:hypothetical protein